MRFLRFINVIAAIFLVLLIHHSAAKAAAANRYNMSYIYFGSTSTYYQHVEATQNSLNEISPSYFDLKNDGSLELTWAIDTRFISEMHNQGIKVVPFLSNHWDRAKGIQALRNRQQLTDQLVAAVKKYNLDGVNVDIENVTETERDLYTDFVKLLREKLPKDKTIAVGSGKSLGIYQGVACLL